MENEDKEISDENVLILILIALHGYEQENHEVFSVDKNVLGPIYADAIDKGLMPVLAIKHGDDDRLLLQITLEDLNENE